MIDDYSLIAGFIVLFVASLGFGAGCYVAYRILRYAIHYDEQRMYWKQRRCGELDLHVWEVTCKRCGVEQKRQLQ